MVVLGYERTRLMEQNQGKKEPFEHFLRDCYSLTATGKYDDKADMLLDHNVQGLTEKKARKKLELMPNLTLTKAIKIARQYELVESQENERLEKEPERWPLLKLTYM